MNLPNYMTIICNLSGDVLQQDDKININTIFDIINEKDITQFHEYIKSVFEEGKFINMYKVKLLDGLDYYLNLQVFNNKITFIFNRCPEERTDSDIFWVDSSYKYEYYLRRDRHIMSSVSKLIDNLFYKNRTDINDILKDLCSALKFQSAMLLFRNGKDHIVICEDSVSEYVCKNVESKQDRFKDENFHKDIDLEVSTTLKIKKYENTYFSQYADPKNKTNKRVYVLQLVFGPKIIGYLEAVAHTYINFTPVELKIFQSLSTILAYVINNKREQAEIEDYIKEKLIQIN